MRPGVPRERAPGPRRVGVSPSGVVRSLHSNILSNGGNPMSMLVVPAEVAVWLVNGVPARLVWEGAPSRPPAPPPPLPEDGWSPALPPAARRIIGWRLQGTTAGGQSLMFDLVEGERGW